MPILILIFAVLFGLGCSSMAKSRGRSQGLGFALGLLFGVLAVIGYALAGKTNEKEKEIFRDAIKESKNTKKVK